MDFKELKDNLSPVIKRIAYKLNGHYRTFGHEDLFQEALMHLWTNFMAGKLQDKTESYILQGCYFHLKNYIRKVNEKPELSLDEINSHGLDAEEPEYSFSNDYPEDTRSYLNDVLLVKEIEERTFDTREKKVIALLKKGATTRDIGRALGVSHVMAVKLIKKIRIKCKIYIDPENQD